MPIKLGIHTGPQNLSMAELHRLWKRADEAGSIAVRSTPASVVGHLLSSRPRRGRTLAPRYNAWRQALNIGADIAWTSEPDTVAVVQNVLERPPQLAYAIGPAYHKGVQ